MNEKETMQKYKEEKCNKCSKNIDCKILVRNNKAYCTEEEE